MSCIDCRFTPCLEAQGTDCCMNCEFGCSSKCEKVKERENKMNIKTKKAEEKEAVKNVIKVTRGHVFDDGTVAFDMEVNGVSIYNSTLREGKNGQFVSFPSRKGKDGKYYSHCFVKLSEEDTKSIVEQLEVL